jgi:hypothetical protein
VPVELAGRGVVGLEVAAHAVLGPGDADDHLVADHELRAGRGHRLFPVVDGLLPDHAAVLAIEREQAGIESRDVDQIILQRDATVDRTAAEYRLDPLLVFRLERPQGRAGTGVEREHAGVVGGEVEHAVPDQRRRLEPGERPAGRERPDRAQLLDVVRGDLVEWAEALIAVVAPIHQPFGGVVLGFQEILCCDRRPVRGPADPPQRREQRHAERMRPVPSHHPDPLLCGVNADVGLSRKL